MLTRLDRIYSQDVGSSLAWLEVEVDSQFGRRGKDSSDHFALRAKVQTHAPNITRTPIDRIDPTIITDPKMNYYITQLWEGIYERYNPEHYGHAQVWSIFKQHLYEMLIMESKERRNNRGGGEAAYWKKEREHEINKANREGPSQEHLNKLKLIDEAAKAAHERAHPPRGFKAMLRVDAEERSSKSFFSLFKNKLASAGINCLHVTNDWTDPNTKSGITNTVTDILNEATKYYTYLFI